MTWRLDVSRNSEKFLQKEHLSKDEVFELVSQAIRLFRGERINIDVKKLKGRWRGFYRIRSRKMRIIAEFDFENQRVFIEEIDWRGGVYKQ